MEKCASPSTQLHVDEAILDYLIYNASRALIKEWKCSRKEAGSPRPEVKKSDLCLQLVDLFLSMFRSMHANHCAPSEIRFRLQLLKLTSMFSARSASTSIKPSSSRLRAARKANKGRATQLSRDPIDIVDEAVNRSLDLHVTSKSATSLYAASTKITLLDILPSFMAVSAFHSILQDSPITEIWMRLATGLMAHAALEQCLVLSIPLSEALREAFAWGFDAGSTAKEDSEDSHINAMFLGEDEEVAGWSEIKAEHIQALIPPEGTSLVAHAETLLADELPLEAFEQDLMSFIESLLIAHPRPLYKQLESGKVDGVSRKSNRVLQGMFSSERLNFTEGVSDKPDGAWMLQALGSKCGVGVSRQQSSNAK